MPSGNKKIPCEGGCSLDVLATNAITCSKCNKKMHSSCISKHKCTTTDTLEITLHTSINELRNEVGAISNQLKRQEGLFNNIEAMLLEIKQLRDENSKLRESVDLLNDRLNIVEGCMPHFNVTANTMHVVSELNDQRNRQNNVIMFNLPESSERSTADANADDLQKIKQALDEIGTGIVISSVTRLDKKEPGKTRPVKVTFANTTDAKLVLKNPKRIENINIKSDQTPLQREYLKQVKSELKSRRDDGENNLTIKFKNGLPTIIQSKN